MKNLKSHLFKVLLVMATVVLGQSALTTNAPTFLSQGHIRYIIQTDVNNPAQLTKLSRWLMHNNFDVAGMRWHRGQIEVITSQAGVDFLTKAGLKGSELLTDDATRVDNKYLNPSTLEAKLKAINQAYPALTRLEQIGSSLQGRPIYALLISTTPNANDPKALTKPTLIIDGQHHAREVMTSEVVADVADVLLKSSERLVKVQQLISRWNVWLVPMINVDGTNIVFSQDNMWRKNAHGDQRNVYGVDINRNYPYRWNGCNGSSSSHGAQDYHGDSAASEPETQAMVNLGNKIRPTASLSYHSYSEFVLYPLGCNGEYAADKDLVVKIAGELASKLPSDDGRGNYTQGTPWELLYDVDGSSMDYFYASFGTLAYTFEINQEFQPSYSKRDPTLQKERVGWQYFMTRIDQNLLHVTVVDAKTKAPAEALIGVNTIAPNKGELPFKTNEAGHYFKVLDPGHYVIGAKLADGRAGQVEIQMNGQPQDATITVQ